MTAALLDSTLHLFSIKWPIPLLLNFYTLYIYSIGTIVTSPEIKRFINQSFKPHHNTTLLSCYDAMMSLLLNLKMSYLEDREIEMQCIKKE